jgi:hypothetical protein
MNILSGSIGALMMALTGLGAVLCFQIWLTLVAFTVRWWWGLVVFFVPFGGLIFAITNWQVAKKPFLTGVVFFGLALGMFILRAFIETFFVVSLARKIGQAAR